jgi:hypothetical protein
MLPCSADGGSGNGAFFSGNRAAGYGANDRPLRLAVVTRLLRECMSDWEEQCDGERCCLDS